VSTTASFFICNLKEIFACLSFSDTANGILRVNGTFTFSPFCIQTCQNSLMARLSAHQGQLQTAKTIQISNAGGSTYTFILQAVKLINKTTGIIKKFFSVCFIYHFSIFQKI
jgi:hypothetical protein